MTLLIEDIDLDSMICEVLEEAAGKKYSIRGPFIEANIKNKNNRIYPGPVIRPQVEKYQDAITENRAVGELNHPATLEIDPKNISHKITSLKFEGANVVMGEAVIGGTNNGMTVRALMDMGVKLGVSSRGAGTLKEGIVQKDYKYVCNDIVWEPSAPSAFVEGILEAKTEWLLENDILVEKDIDDLKSQLSKFGRKNINKVRLDIFEQALDKALHNSRNQ
jgi:hypothetical protein